MITPIRLVVASLAVIACPVGGPDRIRFEHRPLAPGEVFVQRDALDAELDLRLGRGEESLDAQQSVEQSTRASVEVADVGVSGATGLRVAFHEDQRTIVVPFFGKKRMAVIPAGAKFVVTGGRDFTVANDRGEAVSKDVARRVRSVCHSFLAVPALQAIIGEQPLRVGRATIEGDPKLAIRWLGTLAVIEGMGRAHAMTLQLRTVRGEGDARVAVFGVRLRYVGRDRIDDLAVRRHATLEGEMEVTVNGCRLLRFAATGPIRTSADTEGANPKSEPAEGEPFEMRGHGRIALSRVVESSRKQ